MDFSVLREKYQVEKQKLDGMTRKEAVSYIATYYGVAILAILAALAMLISLCISVHNNKLRKPVVTVGLLQNYSEFGYSNLEEDLAAAYPDTDEHTAPMIMSFYDPNTTSNGVGAVQLMAYLSAGELDAMICDKATLTYMEESDLLYYPEGSDFPGYDISGTKLGQTLIEQGATEVYYILLQEDGLDEAISFGRYLLENG